MSSYRLIQKSKSVSDIMFARQKVGEVRQTSEGFKLIVNGQGVRTYSSCKDAWEAFAEPVRRRNAQIRREREEYERRARNGEYGQDEQDMMVLLDALDTLNRSLER